MAKLNRSWLWAVAIWLLCSGGCGSCAGRKLTCREGTVLIPPGTFTMGDNSDDFRWGGKPEHQVTLTKAYCIDRTEVTQAAYYACFQSKRCVIPDRKFSNEGTAKAFPMYPADYVYWEHAKSYCEANGGRLPTEAEWEYAARGSDGRKYPWGNESPTHEHARYRTRGTAEKATAVGTHPKGRSPFGVEDMAGNVNEWVSDPCGEYGSAPRTDPTGPARPAARDEPCRLKRGSNWGGTGEDHRVTRRWPVHPNTGNDQTGFRCVYPPQ